MRLVPYRDARRKKRAPLDRETIVRAALRLLDEVGLDALTMRRLAEHLGVQAASLYRHVESKQVLLVLLGDRISSEVPLSAPEGTWQEQLLEMARRTRRGLSAHRDAARVLASTAPSGPSRLRHVEAVLAVLRAAGLSARDTARTAYHLNNCITEFAADEARFAATGAARKRAQTEMRRGFESLPPQEFPVLVELADALTEDDSDGLFEFGVRAWIDAIESLRRSKKR